MGEYREGHSNRDYEKRYDPRPPLPTRSMMGGRIYIGKLPNDIREKEIEKVFVKFGKITEIALKGNYCFVVSDLLFCSDGYCFFPSEYLKLFLTFEHDSNLYLSLPTYTQMCKCNLLQK